MAETNQLSRGGALVMGGLFVASGVIPLLLGATHPRPSAGNDAPKWIGIAVCAMFILAGISIVLDYAIAGGISPDGDFAAGTPMAIRIANLALGSVIVGLMTAVFGWVAFGPGTRHFTATLTLPFMPIRWRSNELTGRIAFGVASVLMAAAFIACGISGLHRLWRATSASNAR